MREIDEITLRNAIYETVMDFFIESTPMDLDFREPVANLTDKLINTYEKWLDRDRTN